MSKTRKPRSYHPEFVSQATLSYLLDCSQSTVDSYVERGILPAPMKIGNLKRWWWPDVLKVVVNNGISSMNGEDEFEMGIAHVSKKAAGNAA